MKYPDNKPYILAAKGNYRSVIRIDLLLLEIVHVIPSSTLFSPQASMVGYLKERREKRAASHE